MPASRSIDSGVKSVLHLRLPLVSFSDLLAFSPAALALALGGLTFVSNRRRRANQAAGFVFLTIAAWATARGLATHGVPLMFRATTAIGGAIPGGLAWLAAALTETDGRRIWRACRGFALGCLPLVVCPWLESFTPYQPPPGMIVNGPAYYLYVVWALLLYAMLMIRIARTMRRVDGMARLEVGVIALTLATACLLILAKMGLQSWLPVDVRHLSSPIIMLAGLSGMAWVFFTRRVFDAHYLIRLAGRYAILVVSVTIVSWLIHRVLEGVVPDWLMFTVIAMAVLAAGHELRVRLDRWLFHFPAAARARAVLHIAARQTKTEEDFRREFQNIVAGWARADGAALIPLAGDDAPGSGEDGEAGTHPVPAGALRRLGWVTPERLERERPTAATKALASLLGRRRLGALVTARGAASTVAVGLGPRATREPYTYPDIEQLMEFAEIAEAAMERLRLTAGIVQSEKLATVGLLGASLAHEIRNPLYAIRAFVELLPANYDRTEFREQFTGLVGSEVVRIDHLISQLMNLASPRPVEAKPMSLHDVIGRGVELLSPKARANDVVIETDLRAQSDRIFADADALKQVLLNLGLNAIHAQEKTGTRRWIRIATRDQGNAIELVVSDGGPGIAPQVRSRLFEPFQSTHRGGLGLGLSVTRQTLARFGAVIAADDAPVGSGAVFRVTFSREPGPGRREDADTPPGARLGDVAQRFVA